MTTQFRLSCDEIAALDNLRRSFPKASFDIKKKVQSVSDSVDYVELAVRIYGYTTGTWVWRNTAVNGREWTGYPEDVW